MDKQALRKEIVRKLRAFPGRAEESSAIVRSIQMMPEWREAETILAFSPMRDEPDITPLLADSRVLLPYIEGDMLFSASRCFHRAKLGFSEPEHTEAEYKTALMLVPLVGYNATRHRLGRGGGYYDRYIQKNRDRLVLLGVALSPSYVPQFVPEAFDAVLDMIITANGIYQ